MKKTRNGLLLLTGILLLLPVSTLAAGIFPDLGGFGLSDKPIYDIVANFLKWILSIFGFIAIAAFLISGIQYFLSAGNEEMQQRAKRNFTYSVIGVVAGLSGLIIVTAIQNMLGGSSSRF